MTRISCESGFPLSPVSAAQKWTLKIRKNTSTEDGVKRTQMLQFEQFAELVRENSKIIVVQHQLSQSNQIAELGRETAQFVGRQIQVCQVDQTRNVGRQT
jgi:hypothetical protein